MSRGGEKGPFELGFYVRVCKQECVIRSCSFLSFPLLCHSEWSTCAYCFICFFSSQVFISAVVRADSRSGHELIHSPFAKHSWKDNQAVAESAPVLLFFLPTILCTQSEREQETRLLCKRFHFSQVPTLSEAFFPPSFSRLFNFILWCSATGFFLCVFFTVHFKTSSLWCRLWLQQNRCQTLYTLRFLTQAAQNFPRRLSVSVQKHSTLKCVIVYFHRHII